MTVKADFDNEENWIVTFIDFPNQTIEVMNTETQEKKELLLAQVKIKFVKE